MRIELDELITIDEPGDLSSCSLAELRVVRDHYQDVEHGLSYARRIVQGRLDTVSVELERRGDVAAGEVSGDLLERLPDALAAHTRGPGLPRPFRDLEPPVWADSLLVELDEVLTPSQLAEISELDGADLATAAARMGDVERDLSAMRHEVHRRVDRVQDELVGRYRSGATVDDLLT